MSKRSKVALVIGVIAAVISAVILVIMFWDKLLEKCPCRKKQWEDFLPAEEEEEADIVAYTDEEAAAFADLETE